MRIFFCLSTGTSNIKSQVYGWIPTAERMRGTLTISAYAQIIPLQERTFTIHISYIVLREMEVGGYQTHNDSE
jgi:hypothetical protein